MRIPPQQFVADLDRNFHGRMRIRWSNQKHEWQIEEKVARGLLPDMYVSSENDTAIRLRDGYGLVCAIKTGDRMPCPKCNTELRVPIHEFAEVRCPFCAHRGRSESVIAGYFDLNDRLIEHLRKISAEYAWRDEILNEIKHDTERREVSQERELDNIAQAALSDGYNRMNEVLQVGYTPKTDAMRVEET